MYYFSFLIFNLYIFFLYLKNKIYFPKQFNSDKIINKYFTNKSDRNIRNRFSKRKIPDNIDIIIIGSGIGSLTCAGLLSRVGKRVLVLEQHYIAGGSTHTFEDKGYEFDTGVHYVGNIGERKKIIDLITYPHIQWDKMGNKENDYLYDEIVIEGDTYHFKAGKSNFLKEIEKYFPQEIENVIEYLDYLDKVSKQNLFFLLKVFQNKFISNILNKLYFKYIFNIDETALEVVERYTKNKKLQAVLLGQFGDYGKSPKNESFFIHSRIFKHYLDGAWYPNQGSSIIAKNIIPIIENTGGKVLVGKSVKSVLVNNNYAYGVIMENDVKIYANKIISGCGLWNTWNKLVEEKYVPKSLTNKLDKIGLSASVVYLFVGMNKSPEELNLRSSNIWHLPNKDYDELIYNLENDPLTAPIPLFIGFPCAKDKSWNERYPNKSNAVILTFTNYKHFEEWENCKQGNRGEDYEEFKNQFADRILNEGLYKYYPQTKDCIDYINVGTPLTFNHYINSHKGEIYGLNNSFDRLKDVSISPKTHIENLYLTGQDITTLGFTGGLMGGVLTSNSILGYGTTMDILTDRNLIKELNNLKI